MFDSSQSWAFEAARTMYDAYSALLSVAGYRRKPGPHADLQQQAAWLQADHVRIGPQ